MQKRLCVLLFSALLTSVCAFGQTDLEFQIASGGTISYSTGGSLVGTDLAVSAVTGQGTPDNSGAVTILDGALTFTSGIYTGGWSWGSGGTLSLTGCIEVSGSCLAGETTSTVLVSDDFSSATVTDIVGGLGVQAANFTGTLDPTLAAYFGVSTTFTSPATSPGELDELLGLSGTPGSAFSAVGAGNGDVTLDTPAVAPEPSTAILWCTGIVLAIVTRKRLAHVLGLGTETHCSPVSPS